MTPLIAPARPDTDTEFARIVDELTRRGFLAGGLGGAALLGLAACGSSGSGGDHSSSSAAPSTRAVQGAYGPIDVPADPKRVVALGKSAVTTLLDLGLTPIGVDEGEVAVAIPQYATALKHVPTVGAYGEFNAEKILALKPDLLIGYDTYIDRQLFNQVKDLVPTYAQPNGGSISWKDSTTEYAAVLNRPSQLAAWKQKYSDRLAQIKATYRDQLVGNRWELVKPNGPGAYLRFLPSADALQILAQLGGTLGNAGATGPTYFGSPLSYESIPDELGKATVVLCIESGNEPLTSSPLWKKLPAVNAGHAYLSNDLFPAGYSGGIALLDFFGDVCQKLAAR